MEYTDEDFDDVSSNRVRRFLSDTKVRTKAVRKFYQDKGIFLLSDLRANISDELPYFILNFTSIDELQAYSGKKVYGSLSGMCIELNEDTQMEIIYNGLSTNKDKNDKDGVHLTDIKAEKSTINALLRYENTHGGIMLLGKSQTARRIIIEPSKTAKRYLVNCEVHSLSDYTVALRYFKNSDLGIKSRLVEFDISAIKDTKLKHSIIINSLKEVETINVTIRGKLTEFKFLGVYSHNVVKAEDLAGIVEESTEYGKKLEDSSNNIQLTSLDELLPLLENELKSYTSVFDGLYWSEKEKKYLVITFVFNKSLILIYNSTRTYEDNEKMFNAEDFQHPIRRKEYNELTKIVLPEEEIRGILSNIWSGCADYLSNNLNPIALGKLKESFTS